MRPFLFFAVIFSLLSCSGQKTASIYLAHCDTLFYIEENSFDVQKIKRGKMNDSVFINELFKTISPSTHILLFKPYTDLCTDDGMGPLMRNWKTLLAKKGYSDEVLLTDSIEDAYFGDICLRKYVDNQIQSRNNPSRGMPSVPKPPPIEMVITKDGKPIPGYNEDVLFIKAKGAVTFLLSANNVLYYYEGVFTGIIHKTDFNSVGELIKKYKDQFPNKDLMFIIKATESASFKNAVDILNEITTNKVPAGHYLETDITDKEIKSIHNFKEN